MMFRTHRLAASVILLLFLVLALLTPMAYAIPPDPSWIHGLYDGGDFDDVALVVTSGAGIVELSPVADLSSAPPPIVWPIHSGDGPVSTEHPGSLHSRAPPRLVVLP